MSYYIIFSVLLGVCYFLLFILYKIGWQKIKTQYDEPKLASISLPFVTIIVPARNEAYNIAGLLDSIINNKYPHSEYEIIVIDDFSDDATAAIAQNIFQVKGFRNGKVLHLSKYLSENNIIRAYKKKALEIAIDQSRGDIIITTDGDCIVPPHWISSIVNSFQDEQIQFVAAPVLLTPYRKNASVLYYFQHLDFMTMQGITAAVNALKIGNMCNGANLAFRKKGFYEVGGYQDINHLASGDDMMLMNKFDKHFPNSITYLKATAAIVNTPVQPDIHSFFQQRIRWASKSGKYNDSKLNISLILVYLFNCNFLMMAMLGFFDVRIWHIAFTLLLIKTIVEFLFLVPVARFFQRVQSCALFPLLQPFHILYIISAGFLGFFGKYEWKGRIAK